MNDQTDLRDYFDILIRRWYVVVPMPVLAMIATALVTFAIKPTYEATATIALAPATVSISLANQLPPYYLMVNEPRRLPTAYTPTYYMTILKGADVVAAARPQAAVTISADGSDRSLLHITARGNDPKQAADTANTYAQAGAQRIQQLLQPTGEEATAARKRLEAAEQAVAQYARANGIEFDASGIRETLPLPRDKESALQQLLRERDIAESVYLDFAREYERTAILASSAYRPTTILASVPTSPVSPKLAQNVLIAAVFGLLIGILGAFAAELVVRRPKD